MIILGCWVAFAFVVGWVATQRGRGAAAWFGVALVASPVMALLILIALPPRPVGVRAALPPAAVPEASRPDGRPPLELSLMDLFRTRRGARQP